MSQIGLLVVPVALKQVTVQQASNSCPTRELFNRCSYSNPGLDGLGTLRDLLAVRRNVTVLQRRVCRTSSYLTCLPLYATVSVEWADPRRSESFQVNAPRYLASTGNTCPF
jgi:hypothetical protein